MLNFGLIPDTLNPTSNITIDSNNWSVKVETDENKTSTKSEPPSKRTRIDTGIDNVESESYDSDTFSSYYEELCKILPHVVSVLNANNQLDVLLKFFTLVANENFDFENICYLQFVNLINFLSSGNIHAMRYQTNVKHFWRLGYKMFGGRFLRFMGGFKNTCQVADGSTVHAELNPLDSKINFVVPDKQVLVSQSDMNIKKPGIMTEMLDTLSSYLDEPEVKLCFDGKKINSGFGQHLGDVDMWGYESSPTLVERKAKHENTILQIESMVTSLEDTQVEKNIEQKQQKLKGVTHTLSQSTKTLRESNLKKSKALEKWKNDSGSDRQYSFVINMLETILFRGRECVKETLEAIDQICPYLANSNHVAQLHSSETQIYLERQANFACLIGMSEDLIDTYKRCGINVHEMSNVVKQRSEMWHQIRQTAKVTGSTANAALGLDSLKKQVEHFDHVINKLEKQIPSADVQILMDNGSKNEINEMVTCNYRSI